MPVLQSPDGWWHCFETVGLNMVCSVPCAQPTKYKRRFVLPFYAYLVYLTLSRIWTTKMLMSRKVDIEDLRADSSWCVDRSRHTEVNARVHDVTDQIFSLKGLRKKISLKELMILLLFFARCHLSATISALYITTLSLHWQSAVEVFTLPDSALYKSTFTYLLIY